MSYAGILWSDGALITVRPPVCRKGGCGHPADPGSEWCPQHHEDVTAQVMWAIHHPAPHTTEAHGTESSYSHGCHCPTCRAGHAQYTRGRRRSA